MTDYAKMGKVKIVPSDDLDVHILYMILGIIMGYILGIAL